ncbi:MAG: hypothetical protein LBF34_03215 [Puniceicoccales bacterium]|jgi:hypothetical protein|nr:hypothetical protein [Puniceicoccales bacterium]
MEIVKRTIKAIIYAFVGGLGGGMGAVAGSVSTRFRLSIRAFKVTSMIAIPVSILYVYFRMNGVSLSEAGLKLISVLMATPLVVFVWIVVPSFVEYVEYVARGMAMGAIRGARGGILGGSLGGAINGIESGILLGFVFWIFTNMLIRIYFNCFKKLDKWYWEQTLWIILIFALLRLITGMIGGAQNYTSKIILKNDTLKDVFRSTFKYALRGSRLRVFSEINWASETKSSGTSR